MATTLTLLATAELTDPDYGRLAFPNGSQAITVTAHAARTYALQDGVYTNLDEGDVGTPRLWLLWNQHATTTALVKIDSNAALALEPDDFAIVPCVLGMSAAGSGAAGKLFAAVVE